LVLGVSHNATDTELSEYFRRGAYHALHLVTRTEANPANSSALNVLDPLADSILRRLFIMPDQGETPRLPWLSACRDPEQPDDQMAAALCRLATYRLSPVPFMQGRPSAVVTQQPTTASEVEALLAHRFYLRLTDGSPIDRALHEASLEARELHRALHEASLEARERHPQRTEWAGPVLTMNVPDGRLFEAPESATGSNEQVTTFPTPELPWPKMSNFGERPFDEIRIPGTEATILERSTQHGGSVSGEEPVLETKLREQLETLRKRLRQREIQSLPQGLPPDPGVLRKIKDLNDNIARLEERLRKL
jgi:hypothetical protein